MAIKHHSEYDWETIAGPELRAQVRAKYPNYPVAEDESDGSLRCLLDSEPVACKCNSSGCWNCRPEAWC